MSRASIRAAGRVAAALLAVTIASHAAAQAVYRCDDGKGGTLYADAPCKGGAKVDLLPGNADPAAIERLRREQRAFDERQAAREARAEREARALREQRWAERSWPIEFGAPVERPLPDWYYWGGVWPWYSVAPEPPPMRPRPPRPEQPPAPYVPAAPGRLGMPAPPPVQSAPRPPAPALGRTVAPAPRG